MTFRKKNLLTELLGLDAREELLGLLNDEKNHRIQIKGDIEHLASLYLSKKKKNIWLL